MRDEETSQQPPTPGQVVKWFLMAAAILVALGGCSIGSHAGCKAYGRTQKIADVKNDAKAARIRAANETQVNSLRIAAQGQKIEIAKKDAEIRTANAKGIKAAQDEIAKTLTPLYIQFEYAQALQEIAKSGRNNSVVFIPSGPGGVPIVPGLPATGVPQIAER